MTWWPAGPNSHSAVVDTESESKIHLTEFTVHGRDGICVRTQVSLYQGMFFLYHLSLVPLSAQCLFAKAYTLY